MWGMIANLPFIGKHKTLLGSAGLVASLGLSLIGQSDIATQVQDISLAVTGIGLLDKGRKNRH